MDLVLGKGLADQRLAQLGEHRRGKLADALGEDKDVGRQLILLADVFHGVGIIFLQCFRRRSPFAPVCLLRL